MKHKSFAFTLSEVFFTTLHNHRKAAFTLAEVLITLGIIGVVAAITLPSLIANQREKVVVTQLKKFYSTFSQAYQMAINEHGTIDNWELTDRTLTYDEEGNPLNLTDEAKTSQTKAMEIILSYYKGNKKRTHPSDNNFILDDGFTTINAFTLNTSECIQNDKNSCGSFVVVLGNPYRKGTSQYHSFLFDIQKYKIVPYGTYQNKWYSNDKNVVDQIFRRECGGNHVHCTAWVLYNENLDYLHCIDNLSWYGARSCKEAKGK